MAINTAATFKNTKDGHVLYSGGKATRDSLPTRGAVEGSQDAQGPFDVIVIGAGFAGLTAARDLSQAGNKVLLLEARDRIGGRAFAARVDGYDYEMGGTWIHWSQPFVWSEVTRYGLSIKESSGAMPVRMSYITGGKLHEVPADDIWGVLADAMTKFCNVDGVDGRTVFPRAHDPLFSESVATYDAISLQDRLDQVDVTPEAKELLNSLVSLSCHGDPAAGSFVEQLRWWALGDFEVGRMIDKLGRYKLKEGTSSLALAIYDAFIGSVMMSCPVASVHDTGSGVTVTAKDGRTFKAKAAICALPMNILKDLEFSPPLAPQKVEASRLEHTGKGSKFWVKIDEKIGPWFGMAPFPSPLLCAWTDSETEDGTHVVCFGSPDNIDLSNFEAVEAAVHTLLPNVTIRTVVAHDWADDEYAKGSWCFYRTGELTASFAALQASQGAIHFAGADWANGWRGCIDGAIESGMSSATKVARELRTNARGNTEAVLADY